MQMLSIILIIHLASHDKMPEDRLNVNSMDSEYGGTQPHMHDIVLTSVGPHSPKFLPGDTQQLVFTMGDDGPYYESEEI